MATIKKPAKKMQMGGKTPLDKLSKNAGFSSNNNQSSPLKKGNLSKDEAFKKVYSITKKNGEMALAQEKENQKRKEQAKTTPTGTYKKGGVIKKAKSGGSFPDLNKDGKITKADVLVGRGVIKAKKGAALKKQAAVAIAMKKAGKAPKKAQSGASFKNITDMFGRTGGFDGGMRNQMAASILKKKKEASAPAMKKGGKMKKCAYGCK